MDWHFSCMFQGCFMQWEHRFDFFNENFGDQKGDD